MRAAMDCGLISPRVAASFFQMAMVPQSTERRKVAIDKAVVHWSDSEGIRSCVVDLRA